MKKWFALPLCFLFLALDVAAKLFALSYVPAMIPKIFGYPYGGVPIFSWAGVTFSLNTVINTGAAWGFLPGHSGLLFLIRVAIMIGLLGYLLRFHRTEQSPLFPFWLVLTGAIGNGIDYLAYGHVIDFFHFCFWGHSFAIFNLADCYITIGAILLFFLPRRAQLKPI
jgi:signal peptidase II